MLPIEKGIPVKNNYVGRKSKKRDDILATLQAMEIGDSFRVEYRLTSMRNLIRVCGVEGRFKSSQEGADSVRVWKVG